MSTIDQETHIFITGGSGFLGQYIIKAILERHPKWRITVLDLVPPPPALLSVIHNFHHCDITSPSSLTTAFSTCPIPPSLVFHTAGCIPSGALRYSTSSTQWQKVKNINYHGTQNVLSALLASGCTRLVYTSSCTVLQDDLLNSHPNTTESIPIAGRASVHYGRSKALAESHILNPNHRKNHALLACALRPCTLIGKGDTAVMKPMHSLIAERSTNFILGKGDNLYDFMCVENAADAHLLAAENLLSSNPTAAGEVFFVSNEEPVYFWDFLAAVWAGFGHVPAWRIHVPFWLALVFGFLAEMIGWVVGGGVAISRGSVRDSVRTGYADCGKARRVLGWEPRVRLREGVKRWVEGYKEVLREREEVKRDNGRSGSGKKER
ncbi:uncharacterized protein MYCGRDRAFT_45223 [Zymoseptoria tritici IPO323]|uniref:3-beta hydroxysteroid dehydrogenase/isomerase domain-containing protein n=1 Tax=Zymoseptoria tritici (strain CBS 115943 / IPO323) TaxID=336722 RepID=F9XFQ6_ZYMTI|nr:uncharacterized protein MYCGRDRAFT_45223 [Zymoseptoria tritici IPO323]EGP85671.1 hypothetical protein MYCGRDRAFT_45223 [Zymoseptoria tritici IPO323]